MVHQGSALSPLLFILVMEEATKACKIGDPWELLYADDLVLTAETKEEVTSMFLKWKEAMEIRGLRINMSKTKLMVTGKQMSSRLQSGRYPCAVCGQGVGANSALCTVCDKWCHKRCSGLSSLANVLNFSCPRCSGQILPVQREDDTISVHGEVISEVEQFCYLGDVVDGEGGSERAVRSRVSTAWMRWRELASLLCNRSIPICHRARVYEACIRSTMLYGSETWAVTRREEDVVVKCDRRMLRRMCGVQLSDRVATVELLQRCGVTDIERVMRRRRLNWFGHVMRRDVEDPLRRIQLVVAPGRRPRGRP